MSVEKTGIKCCECGRNLLFDTLKGKWIECECSIEIRKLPNPMKIIEFDELEDEIEQSQEEE